MRYKGFVVVVAAGLSLGAYAKDEIGVKGFRLTSPPTIDGIVQEDEWKEVPYVDGLHDASTGAAYADTGRFWIAYDRDFVYFAARLQESEPGQIRATEYRTNVGLTGDDYIELDLDLSGSLSAFNRFQINPQGATNITIAGGRAAKREWLGAFLAKARKTETGWEAEAKIPWQAMSIPRGGRRDVRFNVQRFVAKNQRTFSYIFVPSTQTNLTPTWSGVELPAPEVDHSLKLLPYTYVGYDARDGAILNAGLDMKTALTDQINLVGSINPDFRNIENRILTIDFSRFERLAGETRPFFQEGSQYSASQIFATQRIRGFDAGVNSYGRISDTTSFSVIGTADFGGETDAILNVTHDPDPNTSIRVTGTSLDRNGAHNQAYLARVNRNFGPFSLFIRDMGSKDSTLGYGRQFDAQLSYSKEGLFVTGAWSRAEAEFNPRLGFVQEVDLQGPYAEIDYNRSFDKGTINDWGFSLYGVNYDHLDGSFYRKEGFASLFTTLRPIGLAIVASADLADFEGSKDSLYTLNLGFPRGNPYNNVGFRIDTGRQAGIAYRSLTGSVAYRMTKKIQFTLRHQSVDYAGKSDQTIFTANYDLGGDRSISGRVVRQSGKTNAYVAYRRSGNEGIEYFLILGDPNAPQYRNSLILKAVVPFQLKVGSQPKRSSEATIISKVETPS